jgi:hypothetical protein
MKAVSFTKIRSFCRDRIIDPQVRRTFEGLLNGVLGGLLLWSAVGFAAVAFGWW